MCKALALRPLLPRLNRSLDLLRRPPRPRLGPGSKLRGNLFPHADAAARALSKGFPGSMGAPCSPRRCCARLNYGQALLTRQARQKFSLGKPLDCYMEMEQLHRPGPARPGGGGRGRGRPGNVTKLKIEKTEYYV